MVADESDRDALRFSFRADGVDPRAFFENELPRYGWTLVDTDELADGELAIEVEGHGFYGQVVITPESGFSVQLVE